MAQFAKVWAIKSNRHFIAPCQIEVTLKSGKVKAVYLERELYSRDQRDGTKVYFYLPAKADDNDLN